MNLNTELRALLQVLVILIALSVLFGYSIFPMWLKIELKMEYRSAAVSGLII